MKGLTFLFWLTTMTTQAQTYRPSAANLAYRDTFQDNRFGLFVHWGLYALLGEGEWVMHVRKIPYTQYTRLAQVFDPESFNAAQWVAMAKAAGMKYITVTSRHHDGFSMWDSKASDYNIVKATRFGRDPLKELSEACLQARMPLHVYYSLLDWGRKDYAFGAPIVNGKPQGGDWAGYRSFMKQQLTELITGYPAIRAIWFDGHWERPTADWDYEDLYAHIHQLNPAIMVGNNHHLAPKEGEDFQMFEKDLPGENRSGYSGTAVVGSLPLETCETMNGSWGFNIHDRNYKTVSSLVHYIVNAAGRNTNFLLNVGPMADGTVQPEFADTLAAVGRWMERFGESVYGTRGGPVAPQPWGVTTQKGDTVYVHLLRPPEEGPVLLPGFTARIGSAEEVPGGAVRVQAYPEGTFLYPSRGGGQAGTHRIIRLKLARR